MCNYITKNGTLCNRAPSRDRCNGHSDLNKFYPHAENVDDAIKMLNVISGQSYMDSIICACGGKTQKRNFHKHFKIKKHQVWFEKLNKNTDIHRLTIEICEQVYSGLRDDLRKRYSTKTNEEFSSYVWYQDMDTDLSEDSDIEA